MNRLEQLVPVVGRLQQLSASPDVRPDLLDHAQLPFAGRGEQNIVELGLEVGTRLRKVAGDRGHVVRGAGQLRGLYKGVDVAVGLADPGQVRIRCLERGVQVREQRPLLRVKRSKVCVLVVGGDFDLTEGTANRIECLGYVRKGPARMAGATGAVHDLDCRVEAAQNRVRPRQRLIQLGRFGRERGVEYAHLRRGSSLDLRLNRVHFPDNVNYAPCKNGAQGYRTQQQPEFADLDEQVH